MKRVRKGEYGYIAYQKKWTIIRTVIYFAICLSVFAIGYITTGTRKNLLTIVAILGCLPASKSLVNVVMFCRAKGCSQSLHEALVPVTDTLTGLYDLFMTSYKTNYAISHLVIAEKNIVAICEQEGTDLNAAKDHIIEHLKQDGYSDMSVKVFSDRDKYAERLRQIRELDIQPLPSQDKILEMLLNISL